MTFSTEFANKKFIASYIQCPFWSAVAILRGRISIYSEHATVTVPFTLILCKHILKAKIFTSLCNENVLKLQVASRSHTIERNCNCCCHRYEGDLLWSFIWMQPLDTGAQALCPQGLIGRSPASPLQDETIWYWQCRTGVCFPSLSLERQSLAKPWKRISFSWEHGVFHFSPMKWKAGKGNPQPHSGWRDCIKSKV